MRSKLHIYGYGSNTSGEVPSATYADGVSGTIPNDFELDTDTNQYESRNNKFIGYIGTGTTNTDLATLPTNIYPTDDVAGQTEIYHFYLAW